MKSDLFMHEVKQTSTVFGRKSDVKVVFHGGAAMTNGDTIILPELARDVDVSEKTSAIMRGYTDHEAGHLRHSDMKLMMRTYETWLGEGKVLLKSLHNAIEDVWLERRVMAEYPGARENLQATATAVNQGFLDRLKSGEITREEASDMNFVGPVAITWAGRKDYGGPTCEACLSGLSAEQRALVDSWVSKVHACESTKDTIKLAERVYAELKASEKKPSEPPKPEKGEKGERGEGEGEGEGEPEKSDDGEPGEGEPEKGDKGEDDGALDGDADTDAEGDGELEGDKRPSEGGGAGPSGDTTEDGVTKAERVFDDFDVKSALERELRSEKLTGAAATEGDRYLPFSTKADAWHHRKLGTDYSEKLKRFDATRYDRALENMQGEVNAIRRKLERALVSKQQRDWVGGREAGRLDSKRFASVISGRMNVFKERTDRAEIDTAMTLLVDLSGSMQGGGKDHVARDCVMAIAEAIDRTGVAYEVIGFDNRRTLPRGWGAEIERAQAEGMRYARWEPLDMVIFKSFEERLFEAKGGLYAIPDFVGGENTDGEAVLMAYSRLKARPERRKVLLTLSDGAPACRSDNWQALHKHLRTAIETLRKDGCACLGVGIQDASVRSFYPESVVVHSLKDLAGEALGLLSKQLLGERVNVDRSALLSA